MYLYSSLLKQNHYTELLQIYDSIYFISDLFKIISRYLKRHLVIKWTKMTYIIVKMIEWSYIRSF